MQIADHSGQVISPTVVNTCDQYMSRVTRWQQQSLCSRLIPSKVGEVIKSSYMRPNLMWLGVVPELHGTRRPSQAPKDPEIIEGPSWSCKAKWVTLQAQLGQMGPAGWALCKGLHSLQWAGTACATLHIPIFFIYVNELLFMPERLDLFILRRMCGRDCF